MASRVQTDIHTSVHTVIQTDIQTYILTYLHSYRHNYMQLVGPETSFKAGLGAMEIACSAMEIAATQTLCEDEASLKAGLEEIPYVYIFLLPHRVCCHWLSAMPAQHLKVPGQAREDTSSVKIDVTSK